MVDWQPFTHLRRGSADRVKIDSGSQTIDTVDDKTFTATHDCIAEEKLSLGLGGDSGGPEGRKAGHGVQETEDQRQALKAFPGKPCSFP